MTANSAELSPTQERSVNHLEGWLKRSNVFVLYSKDGMGRTTMLNEACERLGGKIIPLHEFLDASSDNHPAAIEESFFSTVLGALKEHDHVFVDDLALFCTICGDCNMFYQRKGMFDVVLNTLCTYAIEKDKKLVFGGDGTAPDPVDRRCFYSGFQRLEPEDVGFFCERFLGPKRSRELNSEKIHRFAPKLNAHQLNHVCTILSSRRMSIRKLSLRRSENGA